MLPGPQDLKTAECLANMTERASRLADRLEELGRTAFAGMLDEGPVESTI